MNHCSKPIFILLAMVIFAATSIQAQSGEKMIIALSTDDLTLAETDISTLAVGEAKTIETESGRMVDILRTVDGAEIYVDGELLEMHFGDEGLHSEHVIMNHLEITCDEEDNCEKHVVIHSDIDGDISNLTIDSDHDVIFHEEVEVSCSDEDGDTICSDHVIWISDGEEIDFEEFHNKHEDGAGHKVIVIRKEADIQN